MPVVVYAWDCGFLLACQTGNLHALHGRAAALGALHVRGGDMRLKQIEPGERALGKQNETFVCGKCGRQHSYAVDPNPYAAGASIRFR